MRCGECGGKEFCTLNVRGKFAMPWKDFPHVLLTEDFAMPVCIKCGNQVVMGDAVRGLNDALRRSFELRSHAKEEGKADKKGSKRSL